MKFRNITKNFCGDYITFYSIGYRSEAGRDKVYEMISRDPDIKSFDDLKNKNSDAVILILHDTTGDKILLNLEYRMAVGEWVYNFPAGLIDKNETVSEAAARELCEETGLELTEISEIWKESFSAVGLSNEKGTVIVGKADGTIKESNSDMEEIKAAWYTREEVRLLLSQKPFAARTQAYCSLWSRT